MQVFIYMGQMQSAVAVWEGMLTQEEKVLQISTCSGKLSIKTCFFFIGNDYKKVVNLGKEVYDTPAFSLI